MMILLDDAQSTSANPSSRLYQEADRCWTVALSSNHEDSILAVNQCLQEIQESLDQGQYVVAAFAYELGVLLQKIHTSHLRQDHSENHPLIQAWSFRNFKALSKPAVDQLVSDELAKLSAQSRISGIENIRLSIDENQFNADIAAIQEYIRNGDVYQINHTYRITGQCYGDPLALYARLRDRQPGRFGAYIANGNQYLLSQSPELFIQREGDTFKAMPMKGTADALTNSPKKLAEDEKNQAENVMIVDLLRNDLSQIALPGTVVVPQLFEVARYGDVLQMTSTIQAQARPGLHLKDVLSAVFPCGSITGAPKKRSMEIIQELEAEDRGYYCGALGWLDPSGDFAFSVPIRTVEINHDQKTHVASLILGVGAGITIDSNAKDEWEECHIKSAFLSKLPSEVSLFETILVKTSTPQFLLAHLDRLSHSAFALGIPFRRQEAEKAIAEACVKCDAQLQYRLRLDLATTGMIQCRTEKVQVLENSVKLFWAADLLKDPTQSAMFSGNPLLRHKVANRPAYDEAWREAEGLGGFDALFTNENGFVTEGGRTNLFIQSSDRNQWITPPLSAGLLPGVMRSIILSDPQWHAHEANITIEDVMQAKRIMLTNSLRGCIPAHF